MPADRVDELLRLAAFLSDEERAELAEHLWSTVPDAFGEEWTSEIGRRVEDMTAADARGEPPGLTLTFDEMRARVKGGAADE